MPIDPKKTKPKPIKTSSPSMITPEPSRGQVISNPLPPGIVQKSLGENEINDIINGIGLDYLIPFVFGADIVTDKQGNWVISGQQGHYFAAFFNNTSNSDGDFFTIQRRIVAGTYTFELLYVRDTSGGKVDVQLDGSVVMSGLDMQAGGVPNENKCYQENGIVIETTGLHTIKIIINGTAGIPGHLSCKVTALDIRKE